MPHGKASAPKDAPSLDCGPSGFHTHMMLCLTKSLVSSSGAVFPKDQSTIPRIKLRATQGGQCVDACHFTTLRLWECLGTYPWPQFHYFYKKYFSSKTNITSLHLCCNVFIKDHFSKIGEMLSQREWRNPMSILPETVVFLAGFHKVTPHVFHLISNSFYSENPCSPPKSTLKTSLRAASVLTPKLRSREKL